MQSYVRTLEATTTIQYARTLIIITPVVSWELNVCLYRLSLVTTLMPVHEENRGQAQVMGAVTMGGQCCAILYSILL